MADKLSQLTEHERKILSKVWVSFKVPPEIDYNKLAAEIGMGNPRSAANAWGRIKQKIFANEDATAALSSQEGNAEVKAVGGNDSDGDAANGDSGDATPALPAPVKRSFKKKGIAVRKKRGRGEPRPAPEADPLAFIKKRDIEDYDDNVAPAPKRVKTQTKYATRSGGAVEETEI